MSETMKPIKQLSRQHFINYFEYWVKQYHNEAEGQCTKYKTSAKL